jgi:hypothetical protein
LFKAPCADCGWFGRCWQELDDLHRELFPDEPYGPYIKPAVPVKKTTFVPLSKRNEFG